MKVLSRDFTLKEKILLLFLVLVLVGLVYYQFVYTPVTDALEKAASQKQMLEVELTAVQARVATLQRMKAEIDKVDADGTLKSMPSYNNGKNVIKLLNDVLGTNDFSIQYPPVTKTGDLIRRVVSFNVTTPDYEEAKDVIISIIGNEYRCLAGELRFSSKQGDLNADEVRIDGLLTFYETIVGGEPDAGLPIEK